MVVIVQRKRIINERRTKKREREKLLLKQGGDRERERASTIPFVRMAPTKRKRWGREVLC